MSTASALRQAILDSEDVTTELVTSTHWKGVVAEVRSLSLEKRSEVLAAAQDEDGQIIGKKLAPLMVIACVYDPASGEPVFGDGDRDALSKKSAVAMDEFRVPAYRLNGLVEVATDVAEKNS